MADNTAIRKFSRLGALANPKLAASFFFFSFFELRFLLFLQQQSLLRNGQLRNFFCAKEPLNLLNFPAIQNPCEKWKLQKGPEVTDQLQPPQPAGGCEIVTARKKIDLGADAPIDPAQRRHLHNTLGTSRQQ